MWLPAVASNRACIPEAWAMRGLIVDADDWDAVADAERRLGAGHYARQ